MNKQTDFSQKLKKVEAFLPHKPVTCLRRLACLKDSLEIKTGDEIARGYLIEGRAYLELDNRNKALECFVQGLEIDDVSELNVTELKMGKAFIFCSQNKVQQSQKILKKVTTILKTEGE